MNSETNSRPSRTELRWFGVMLLAVFSVIGAVVGHQLRSPSVLATLCAIGVALALFYYAVPALRVPMFLSWMAVVMPIGRLFSAVLLGLVYFGILTPLALFMRSARRDRMERRFDADAPSYWSPREIDAARDRYFRQS